MSQFETLTGPAFAASYLVYGVAYCLSDAEREQVDTWIEREGVESVHSVNEDSERFTWSGLVHFPEGGSNGLTVCDYVVTLKPESVS